MAQDRRTRPRTIRRSSPIPALTKASPFAAFTNGAMDAAGPVDGANRRAAHKVLGNRFAIPTAPTAQTDGLSTDLNGTEELQILCPPPEVAGFQTFPTGRVWTFGDILAGLGMLVGLAAMPAAVPREEGLLSIVFIASGFVGLRTLCRTPRATVQNVRKGNRAAGGPNKYVLDDHGVDASAMGTRATLEWANIPEAYEDKEFFFLYFSKAWAMLLPKRVISRIELPAFRTALRGWVGERAHLLEG